jgi:hypothetical protein
VEYIGEVRFLLLRDYAGALAAYQQAERMGFQDMSLLDQIYWRMARLGELCGAEPATVARYYLKIIQETPRSGRVYESVQRLKTIQREHPGMDIEIPGEDVRNP